MADEDAAAKPGSVDRSRLERLALVAEIVGSVAVVISVVYLAVQISDNNKLLRSQAHYNALDLTQRPFELMVTTEDLAQIVFECDRRPYDVPEGDWQRCRNYYLMQVNGWEYAYYQNLAETILPELWGGFDRYFSDEVRRKAGYVRFWKETAIGFDDPFRSYAADRVESNPASGVERTGR